jgi:hypothetical protein
MFLVQEAPTVIKAVEDEGSPFRLFLGKASVVYAKQRRQELYRDAVTWEDIGNVVCPEVPEETLRLKSSQILGESTTPMKSQHLEQA